MKIVKLVAENVKRLHAVEVTPGDKPLVTIGGKNGAGKSSVLDSIAYALGGQALVPSEPIRSGEAEAKIVVDLGDLIVTRRFKRELISEHKTEETPDVVKTKIDMKWGETTSTLTVTNKEGAKYPSPQAMLDKLLGKLTFDPLAFARAEAKEQDVILRRLVGLDVTPIEDRRKAAAAQRQMLKRTRDIKEAQLMALPTYKEAPPDEVPMKAISDEMLRAEELNRYANEAERAFEVARSRTADLERACQRHHAKLDELRKQIEAIEGALKEAETRFSEAAKTAEASKTAAVEARAAVPDPRAIRERLTEAEATNLKVRANKRRADAMKEVEALDAQVEEQTRLIQTADVEKRAALESAKFPIEGLGLNDDGVTFNGLPFAQAGSAEQVRVSVAIGTALNPKLKVLLIRNGNLLDDDSLKAVAEQAAVSDMQVWMEYVSGSKDEVAVMLVDGEVA